jgi:hypothetical protein
VVGVVTIAIGVTSSRLVASSARQQRKAFALGKTDAVVSREAVGGFE